MTTTSIEWTMGDDGAPGKTWNPIRGCSKISTGCHAFYAIHVAARFSGPGQPYEGLAKRDPTNWTGAIRLVPEKLAEPLTWRKPARVFVNSMSDLFHEDVPDEYIAAVFGVMAATPQHTYQILTKRAERLPEWFAWFDRDSRGRYRIPAVIEHAACTVQKAAGEPCTAADRLYRAANERVGQDRWPLPNVWLGVSCEDQEAADGRIPHLLATPAAVRFLSVEPLLSDVNLTPWLYGEAYGSTAGKRGGCGGQMVTAAPLPIDWCIVGGESGPDARPCDVGWIQSVVHQCRAADVPVFVKQVGSRPFCTLRDANNPNYRGSMSLGYRDKKGGNPEEWQLGLRVRQFPKGVTS